MLQVATRKLSAVTRPTPGEPGAAFTWLMTALSAWITAALFLDGWAHNHRKLEIPLLSSGSPSPAFTPPGLPTTLTLWHLPYYMGLIIVTGVLVIAVVRNHAAGSSWRRALPVGYESALVGTVLVVAGVIGDLITPGPSVISAPEVAPGLPRFEALPALVSPPHLLQALGIALIVTAPLRAAWASPDARRRGTWRSMAPAVLSLTFLVSILSYMTQFGHPLVDLWPELSFWRRGLQSYRYGHFFFGESMGVLSIVVQTALLMGPVVLVVRRWSLPAGSLMLVFGLNALLMSSLQDRYLFVPSAAGAGLVADLLARRMAPSSRPWEFRIFAATVPAVYYALYFLALIAAIAIEPSLGPSTAQLEGIGWSVELRAGSTLLAAAVGWLLSYLVLPVTSGYSQEAR